MRTVKMIRNGTAAQVELTPGHVTVVSLAGVPSAVALWDYAIAAAQAAQWAANGLELNQEI